MGNINYDKLMAHEPTSYGTIKNSKGQTIEFYEHPTLGDMSDIICACHEERAADYSGFYDLHDMEADHKEYEPSFQDGDLYLGDCKA